MGKYTMAVKIVPLLALLTVYMRPNTPVFVQAVDHNIETAAKCVVTSSEAISCSIAESNFSIKWLPSTVL